MLKAWLPWSLPAPHTSPGTYSDTCTKMSSVPFSGVINPWPWERENCLQTPLKMGPAEARAVLQEEREDFSLVALAQEVAQGEIFAMNTMVPGRAHGTHPQHSEQVRAAMLVTALTKCTRCQGLCSSTGQSQTCWVLTPSRSWSSWWGGGWADPVAGGCPAPRCGCPPVGRGRWATPVTWGSAGAARPVGRWGPMTWWGQWAPPFWDRVGGQQEKGCPGVWAYCW